MMEITYVHIVSRFWLLYMTCCLLWCRFNLLFVFVRLYCNCCYCL